MSEVSLKDCFKNCICVKEEDGWISPKRMTEKQLGHYESAEGKYYKSNSPASVCLDFYSEATSLKLDYKITGPVKKSPYFDVLIDGVLRSSVLAENEESGSLLLPLAGCGKRRITIYLPHLVYIQLKNVEIDAPVEKAPANKGLLLCVGDSITQGMEACKPSSTYPSLLSRFLEYDVINMGVCGATFEEGAIDKIDREPDIIICAYGTNDWGHKKDEDELREHMRAYVKKITTLYSCKNMYAILPMWRSDLDTIRSGMTYDRSREIISEVYADYPFIKVLDGCKLMPPMPDFFGDAGEKKAHPSQEGFLYMVLNLLKEISIH